MIGLGIAAATIATFILSSVYYAVAMPIEQRIVGDATLDAADPGRGKCCSRCSERRFWPGRSPGSHTAAATSTSLTASCSR